MDQQGVFGNNPGSAFGRPQGLYLSHVELSGIVGMDGDLLLMRPPASLIFSNGMYRGDKFFTPTRR